MLYKQIHICTKMPIYTHVYMYLWNYFKALHSETHCKQREHYEVKSGEAYFSVSHQRTKSQMTSYRKQAVWNIYRFCQKFVLGTAQTYTEVSLRHTVVSWWPTRHKLATNNLGMCKTYRMVFLFCSLNQPFAHVTEEGREGWGQCLALAGFVVLPLAKVGGLWTGKHLK